MQYWVGLLALLILLVIGFSMRSTNTLGGPTYDSGDLASQYDQSLGNPTLVRLTHTGSLESDRLNQRRDCLTLHNLSNLIDFDEYAKRLASSQLAPCKYPEFQQQEPF